jgi:hypothetical protein
VYPRRSGTVLTAILALALALAPAAIAAPPRTVDPSTLTPPLNPDFTWTCFDTGAGPICQGTYDDAWQDEDIGWDCDGQPIYTTGLWRRAHDPMAPARRPRHQDGGQPPLPRDAQPLDLR